MDFPFARFAGLGRAPCGIIIFLFHGYRNGEGECGMRGVWEKLDGGDGLD